MDGLVGGEFENKTNSASTGVEVEIKSELGNLLIVEMETHRDFESCYNLIFCHHVAWVVGV